jgi:curved DNA-binding protein CbpA
MNGQLNEHPLAELIREIQLHRLAGTMRLQHEAAKVAVYFEAGEVIYAAANLRELRLSEYLKKHGLATEEQLLEAGNDRSDLSLAAKLTEQGVLDQTTVKTLIGKQVADLLRVVLLWTEGTWQFDERARLGDSIRVKLDVNPLLFQATRKLPHEFVAARFLNPTEMISPALSPPDVNTLLASEGFVLTRVEDPIQLNHLVSLSGLREREALNVIYGLALAGFVERESWPSAIQKGRPAMDAHAAETEAEIVPAAETSVHTLASQLDELLKRLAAASSHYEILDVAETAGPSDIKSSYYALARRYHPDRFHLHAGTPLHSSIESAFAKIAQAYVTLSDPTQRAGYNAKLKARRNRPAGQEVPQSSGKGQPRREAKTDSGGESSPEDDWARAEESFQEGFVALQQGQMKAAVVNLAAAARIAPGEARFRAYYGKALAGAADTRRLAETEMQAAVKLEPGNSTYRIMLAELYCDLGFVRRAANEVKRVISVDANNSEALKLLRKIEATGTPSR